MVNTEKKLRSFHQTPITSQQTYSYSVLHAHRDKIGAKVEHVNNMAAKDDKVESISSLLTCDLLSTEPSDNLIISNNDLAESEKSLLYLKK